MIGKQQDSETGFLPNISWGCVNSRRNPVSWMVWQQAAGLRNRISNHYKDRITDSSFAQVNQLDE